MRKLLIGFDSAWTPQNKGAIVAAIVDEKQRVESVEGPLSVSYTEAEALVSDWQRRHRPSSTVILLDQPTIVKNSSGQRMVEKIVCPAVSLRRGGMQPANTGREDMFGAKAPVWSFLDKFGGPADPFSALGSTAVFETYPVLAMIAMDWVLPDKERQSGRLPKYNPERRGTFDLRDWELVCTLATARLDGDGARPLRNWLRSQASNSKPLKEDQDCLDACLCLLVALHFNNGGAGLHVGSQRDGYIVTPYSEPLRRELVERCKKIGKPSREWIRVFWLE